MRPSFLYPLNPLHSFLWRLLIELEEIHQIDMLSFNAEIDHPDVIALQLLCFVEKWVQKMKKWKSFHFIISEHFHLYYSCTFQRFFLVPFVMCRNLVETYQYLCRNSRRHLVLDNQIQNAAKILYFYYLLVFIYTYCSDSSWFLNHLHWQYDTIFNQHCNTKN